MSTRLAQCTCGQLQASCSGPPLRVSVCHCLACKRATGSAFNYGGHWRERSVTVEGTASSYTRIGGDGGRITNHFCPVCGATVWIRNSNLPEIISIRAGTFADVNFPPPQVSVYHDSRKHSWIELPSVPLEKRG
ncbi:MAG TPA: GFA family protein [Rhodanobacter sp.]|nr:GFA family protein [Rhodanobacter sp.]